MWGEISDFAQEIVLTEQDSTLPLSSIFHSSGLIGGTLAYYAGAAGWTLQERSTGVCVDQRHLLAAVHQVDVAVQFSRQAHPTPPAAHEGHAFNKFHGRTHFLT